MSSLDDYILKEDLVKVIFETEGLFLNPTNIELSKEIPQMLPKILPQDLIDLLRHIKDNDVFESIYKSYTDNRYLLDCNYKLVLDSDGSKQTRELPKLILNVSKDTHNPNRYNSSIIQKSNEQKYSIIKFDIGK